MATTTAPRRGGPERIQKVLAACGLGSRRQIEAWIRSGRLRINGKPAQLGDRITATDSIELDGRVVRRHQQRLPRRRIIAYHKPEGELTTRHDPEGRPTVFEHLPRLQRGRWVAVGRLDTNTSGLLLFTTDGELANHLMHPSRRVVREYAVRVLGVVDDGILQKLRSGVALEDGPAAFEEIVDAGGSGANHWYHVSLREGRNREVRRLWEAVGVTVSRLIRIRYGDVALPPSLRRGQWRELTESEAEALLSVSGLDGQAKSRRRPGKGKSGAS